MILQYKLESSCKQSRSLFCLFLNSVFTCNTGVWITAVYCAVLCEVDLLLHIMFMLVYVYLLQMH